MTNTFKQKLLLGTALVAVGAFAAPAFATAPEEIVATGNQTPTAADEFVNDVDDTDVIELELNDVDVTIGNDDGTAQTAAIDINASDATIYVTDNNNGGDGGGVLTIEADTDAAGVAVIDVANGKTLNLYVGVDDDGTTVADDPVTVVLAGDVEENTSGTVNIIIGGNADATGQVLQLATGAVAQVIDADIKALTNGQGILDINTTGGVTINGDIGGTTAGTDDLAAVNIVDATTVTSNGNIFATAIVIDDGNGGVGATLRLTGTGKTVGGTINSGGGNDAGILDVDGTYTFTGAIGGAQELDSITIGTAGSANFQGAVDLVGAGTGTLTLDGTGSLVTLGKADAAGNSTINFQGAILGKGIVTLNGDDTDAVGQTITGSVGTVAQSIATLNIDNDNDDGATTTDVHTLTANLFASNVNFLATEDAGVTTVGGTLTLTAAAGNSTVTVGTVTTAVAGDGNISLTPGGANSITATVTGDVGTSALGLGTIIVGLEANAGDTTLDFDGNVYATQITVDEDSDSTDAIVSFTGGTQTVTADIDGQQAAEGDINVGNGTSTSTVTFSGQLGEATTLSDFKVFTKSTAILSGADGGTQREHEFAGDITVDGTFRISENALVTANDVATGTVAGVVEFVIGTTDAGVDESATLDLAQAVDWNEFDGTTANSADTLLKQGTGVVLSGQDFLIIDGTGAVTNLAAAGETVDDEYALFNFKAYTGDIKVLNASDNSDVIVEATYADTDDVTINTNNSNAAEGLLDVSVAEYAADTDGANELALVYDNVTRANSSQIDERLEAIQPTVDGGNVVAATSVANITSNIIQLASVDAEGSGIAAGNISNGLRAWGQVFGQTGKQDARDGIDGYDIDSWGFAVGLDTQALADQMVIGLAFSYADSEVDSDNANNTTTEIDTYQITLYGTYNVDEATYVSGQLGYAFGDNSTERSNLGGVASVDANGDFDSNQFIARLEAGRAYEVGSMTTLTPKILANYNYYDADSYSETGAGGAGLNVDQDTLHVFELGAGVDASWMFQQADGSYTKPEVRLGARYDLADDQVEATSNFLGGGAAFKTEGWDPQQFAVDVGAGVTYFSTTNWELTANYDYEWKEDYDSHAGFLRAAYKF